MRRACAFLALLLGCGGSNGGTVVPPPEACPARFAPVTLVEPVRHVGDGTAASCTEAGLRTVVEELNAADGGSIDFRCGDAPHTITLTSALVVEVDLLIDGGGTIALSGGNAVRVLDCEHYVNLVVQRISIVDARAEESGAGIHLPWFGSLKVIDVTFRNDNCTQDGSDIGGGAFFGGGLRETIVSGCTFESNSGANGGAIGINGSNLVVVDSEFTGNVAHGSGGGGGGDGGIGGAIYIDGMNREGSQQPFVLCRSRFEGNSAGDSASAVFRYCYAGETSTVDACLFQDNHVTAPDSGIATLYHEDCPLNLRNTAFLDNTTNKHAAGVFIGENSPTLIENCTFAGNSVPEVGAAIFDALTPLTIVNCTFVDNHADYGPAIYTEEESHVVLRNSILANNTAVGPYNGQSCAVTLDEGGNNLQWPPTLPNGSNDTPCLPGIIFADPLLQPVADNGGPTPTAALGVGSPAIDAGSDCPARDQRGLPRAGRCDIGAFEAQP